MKKIILTLSLFVSFLSTAHADTNSLRVVLQGGAACPGLRGMSTLVRVHQNADGTYSKDSSEFVVPSGYLLEITDIEWQMPLTQVTAWQNVLTLYVQNRSSLGGFTAFSYGYGPMINATEPSAGTLVINSANGLVYDLYASKTLTFGSGILVAPAARACVGASGFNETIAGGSTPFVLRGKLIPDGVSTGVVTGLSTGAVSTLAN
jgi:hypothetical protein